MARTKTALRAAAAALVFATAWCALSGETRAVLPLLGLSLIAIAWAM